MNEVVVAAPVTEEVAVAQAEAVETASDAAVEIARIQADEAVTINEQNNETAVTIAEINHNDEDDLTWLRDQLSALQASHVSHGAKLDAMMSLHQSMSSSLERLLTLIPPSMPAETLTEVETETPDEAAVVAVQEEAATPRRRWM